MARISRMDPGRLSIQALQFRSHQECLTRQWLAGGQGHPGRFWVHGWEHQFQRWWGDRPWQDAAQNRSEWKAAFEQWSRHRLGNAGGDDLRIF
eukprot:267598-Lingulodinium_polyedra.AAC.1